MFVVSFFPLFIFGYTLTSNKTCLLSCHVTFHSSLTVQSYSGGPRGHDRTVVGFTIFNNCLSPLTLCVQIPLMPSVLDTTLCDYVCQWLAAGRLFSPGTPVSSTYKTDCHDITEILLKVALSIINPNQTNQSYARSWCVLCTHSV
jgi:hypothetical protein